MHGFTVAFNEGFRSSVLYRKHLDFSPAFLQGPERNGEFAAYVV